MTVIEIFRAGPKKNGKHTEFCWRLMGRNHKEICRASETYKRKGTMLKVMDHYGIQWLCRIVDLTTKEMEATLTKKRTRTKSKR
jgi:hypothetical protein